jgi:predicted DNA-binding transcriptional regulator AlpA
MSLNDPSRHHHSAGKPKRIIRPKEAWNRMGIGHSKFYEDFVNTGRIRLVRLGARAQGVFEHELDALMEELAAERDNPTKPRSLPLSRAPRSRAVRAVAASSTWAPAQSNGTATPNAPCVKRGRGHAT